MMQLLIVSEIQQLNDAPLPWVIHQLAVVMGPEWLDDPYSYDSCDPSARYVQP